MKQIFSVLGIMSFSISMAFGSEPTECQSNLKVTLSGIGSQFITAENTPVLGLAKLQLNAGKIKNGVTYSVPCDDAMALTWFVRAERPGQSYRIEVVVNDQITWSHQANLGDEKKDAGVTWINTHPVR
ncbi:MAG: hypothetical protein AB1540_12430 [Bdellovibrionota bacterium]